jgi:hypothetical protein
MEATPQMSVLGQARISYFLQSCTIGTVRLNSLRGNIDFSLYCCIALQILRKLVSPMSLHGIICFQIFCAVIYERDYTCLISVNEMMKPVCYAFYTNIEFIFDHHVEV